MSGKHKCNQQPKSKDGYREAVVALRNRLTWAADANIARRVELILESEAEGSCIGRRGTNVDEASAPGGIDTSSSMKSNSCLSF